MMTIAKIASAGAASRYFEGLTRSDKEIDPATGAVRYFAESGEPPGKWHGSESLKIASGSVAVAGQLERILNGQHPNEDKALVQTQGQREHRPGWDLTFSAPKSVSAVWAVGDPDLRKAIEDAHEKAVLSAKAYLDDHAGYTRRGRGGEELEKVSLVGSEYQHSTSREQDPHLHSHMLIMNVAAREDGSWGTIDPQPIYQHRMAAGSLYQLELAARLHDLGFTIEKGSGGTFEIQGVPSDLKKFWSKRHEGMSVTGQSKAAEAAFAKARPHKQHVSRPDLFIQWQVEGLNHGFDATMARNLMNGHQPPQQVKDIDWQEIRTKLTESKSTFQSQDLTKLLAQASYGRYTARDIRAMSAVGLSDPEFGLVRLGQDQRGQGIFTTKEHLERERQMLDTMGRLAKADTHGAKSREVEWAVRKERNGFNLSEEQAQAVRALSGGSRVATLRGAAGAGKTTSMIAVREAYEASGYHMLGATISNQAAQVLQKESGIQSTSISKLLYELQKLGSTIALSNKTVLLVDEAGMVDTPQLAKLVEHVDRAGAKLILLGDEKQLQSIGSGGGFQAARKITQEIGSDAELVQSRRQKVEWQKEAADKFSQGQALEALRLYEQEGRLKTGDGTESTSKELVRDWVKDRIEHKAETQLIIASSHGQGAILNKLAQQALKAHGLIAQVELAKDLVTEKHGKQDLYVGDEIMFRENSKGRKGIGVINGDKGVVQGMTPEGKIRVRLTDGRTVNFDPHEYKNWTLGYASTVHKSQGSTVDRAYYLVSSGDHREMSYVAASRHRKDLTLYVDKSVYDASQNLSRQNDDKDRLLKDIAHGLQKSDEKELALTTASRFRVDDGGHGH